MASKKATRPKPYTPKPAPGAVNERPVDGVAVEEIEATAERHVGGVPLSSLPIAQRILIPYEATDEGIAEKNARRVDSRGLTHSGIQVLVNEGFDQQIRKRNNALEPWESADPLLDAVETVREPGFRYRGLGPAVIRKHGMRGWEAVIGKDGDPVTSGNLVIGKMPIERAERRNKHFRDEGNQNAAEARGRFNTNLEKEVRDNGGGGVRILRDGEAFSDDGDPTRRSSIGVRSSRDQGADAAAV